MRYPRPGSTVHRCAPTVMRRIPGRENPGLQGTLLHEDYSWPSLRCAVRWVIPRRLRHPPGAFRMYYSARIRLNSPRATVHTRWRIFFSRFHSQPNFMRKPQSRLRLPCIRSSSIESMKSIASLSRPRSLVIASSTRPVRSITRLTATTVYSIWSQSDY